MNTSAVFLILYQFNIYVLFLVKKIYSAMAMKILLSYITLQKTSGFGIWMLKINDISFISSIKGITLCISWINEIYYASVVLKAIYIFNLLYHNTGHPAHMITYPVCGMIFSSLSASSWAQLPENLAYK